MNTKTAMKVEVTLKVRPVWCDPPQSTAEEIRREEFEYQIRARAYRMERAIQGWFENNTADEAELPVEV